MKTERGNHDVIRTSPSLRIQPLVMRPRRIFLSLLHGKNAVRLVGPLFPTDSDSEAPTCETLAANTPGRRRVRWVLCQEGVLGSMIDFFRWFRPLWYARESLHRISIRCFTDRSSLGTFLRLLRNATSTRGRVNATSTGATSLRADARPALTPLFPAPVAPPSLGSPTRAPTPPIRPVSDKSIGWRRAMR